MCQVLGWATNISSKQNIYDHTWCPRAGSLHRQIQTERDGVGSAELRGTGRQPRELALLRKGWPWTTLPGSRRLPTSALLLAGYGYVPENLQSLCRRLPTIADHAPPLLESLQNFLVTLL